MGVWPAAGERAMTTSPWLEIRLPDGGQRSLHLDAGDLWRLGRSDAADAPLPWARISREHARLFRRGGQFWLQDAHSRNGVFLNGQRLGEEPVLLSDGDIIVLAGIIEIIFHDPAETVMGLAAGRLRGVWIDPDAREVWVDGRRVQPPLSRHQMRLLQALYRHPGAPLSFEAIKLAVWPEENPEGVSKQALDAVIKRLRQRLRAASPGSNYIQVIRGYGLKLKDEA